MIILVLNSGSSTIKYKLFDQSRDYILLTGGSAERVGLDDAFLRHQKHGLLGLCGQSDMRDVLESAGNDDSHQRRAGHRT